MKYVMGPVESKIRIRTGTTDQADYDRAVLLVADHQKIIQERLRRRPLQLEQAARRPLFRRETAGQKVERLAARDELRRLKKRNRKQFARRSLKGVLAIGLLGTLVVAFRGLSLGQSLVWFGALGGACAFGGLLGLMELMSEK